MSPKSRPPKGKDKKGKKGKKGASSETQVVVEEYGGGVPFGIVVLAAFVISIPVLLQLVNGTMPFDQAALRFLAALAVSWLLSQLVYAVASSFSKQGSGDVARQTHPNDAFGSEGGFDPTMFSSDSTSR